MDKKILLRGEIFYRSSFHLVQVIILSPLHESLIPKFIFLFQILNVNS